MLVRTIVEREPGWLEEDIDAALEWAEWKGYQCQCGHDRRESFDGAGERYWDAKVLKCFACAARDRKRRIMSEGDNPAQGDGAYITTFYDDTPDED